ncbi:MAG: hypothetical protein LBP51_01150, partial [Deferribacteraceae bacterium]|nr:hypothetical protein [Deferribacteraceae bacterium]
MKKFVIILGAAVLVLAGVYFGVRLATESKAKQQLAEFFDDTDWSVDSAYFNPLTQKLVANGLVITEDDVAFSLKSLELSRSFFDDSGAELTGAIDLRDFNLNSDGGDLDFSIKRISSPKIILDREIFQKIVADAKSDTGKIDDYANPLREVNGFKIEGFTFSVDGKKFFSLENIIIDGSYVSKDGNVLPYPVEGVSLAKNLAFQLPNTKKEYKIEKINSSSTYKDGIYDGKVEFDGKELFLLKADFAMSNLSETFEGLVNDSSTLNSFELEYTDRGLVNILLDMYIDAMHDEYDQEMTRETAIEQAAALASLGAFAIKDGAKLVESLTTFLTNPKTIVIKINPEEPV